MFAGKGFSYPPPGAYDALLYKGAIDCSANPNYPAADAGHMYKVSVAGKIGGASGESVAAGDMIICNTDNTVAGTEAAVGAYWDTYQTNLSNPVAVAEGGTGAATLDDGGIVIGNGTGAVEVVAPGTTSQILVGGGAATKPAWGTDIPTGVTIGAKYIYRAEGTDVPVADGGTGASTLTDHGVLIGSGTAAITPLGVATNGQLIIGSTGADPVVASITDGEGIDTTGGAGTLTIACEDASTTNKGVVELATVAEAVAGTSTTLTPTCDGVSAAVAVLAREPDQGVALSVAASGSSGITVADNDNLEMGTGNFTLVWKGSIPDWTSAATKVLINKEAATYYQFDISGDAKLNLQIQGGSGARDILSSVANTFVANTAHELVVVGTVRAVNTTIDFYADGVAFGTQQTVANTGSLSNAANLYIQGTSAARTAGTVHHAYTFNRALTAAEVLDLYRNGISEADKYGSQTSIITGTDSTFAGASNWANVDINAYDETTGGVLTITANAAAQYCTLPVANATTVISKKYRLTYTVASLAATWTIKDFTGTQTIGTVSADGTTSIEFTATTTGGLRLIAVADNSSGVFDNFLLYRIGATLALTPEGIQVDKWYDSSSNALNANYPTTGSSLTRIPDNFHSVVAAKGPAIITTATTPAVAGTVTATADPTVVFSSANDARLAGYDAVNPILGATLISNSLTRYIVSWNSSTSCEVDSSVTWAGTAITSVQLPSSFETDSTGALKRATLASGNEYFVGNIGVGTASPSKNIEIAVAGNDQSTFKLTTYSINSYNGEFMFQRSRGATIGTLAQTSAEDRLGNLVGNGVSTGSTGYTAAQITFTQDAASTASYVPGRIGFFTTNASTGLIEHLRITTAGNILTGGLTAAGTSAAKVLAIGEGTAPTTVIANGVQAWSADYNGTAGDNRLHLMGEGSAAAVTAIGSGKVSVKGAVASGGGFTRRLYEATANITASASVTITLNIPATARILGCQLRVDTALTDTELWDAAYSGGSTAAICSGSAVAKSTKVNSLTTDVTTDVTNIAITKNGGGSFTAAGTIRAIVYTDEFDAMSDAP